MLYVCLVCCCTQVVVMYSSIYTVHLNVVRVRCGVDYDGGKAFWVYNFRGYVIYTYLRSRVILQKYSHYLWLYFCKINNPLVSVRKPATNI